MAKNDTDIKTKDELAKTESPAGGRTGSRSSQAGKSRSSSGGSKTSSTKSKTSSKSSKSGSAKSKGGAKKGKKSTRQTTSQGGKKSQKTITPAVVTDGNLELVFDEHGLHAPVVIELPEDWEEAYKKSLKATGTETSGVEVEEAEVVAAALAASEAAKEGEKAKKTRKEKKKEKKEAKKAKDGEVKRKRGLLAFLFLNKRNRFSFLKLIRNLMFIAFLCCLGVAYYVYDILKDAEDIDPTKIYDEIAMNSVVYDDKGNEIDEVFSGESRSIISYDDMSENIVNAFVAIEDKTFWEHHGFNWIRMAGAVFEKLTGQGEITATSTITQQLARNVYLPDTKSERSIHRKLIEMYYSYKIEKALDKKQIMEAYLNSVYFGFGSYGVAEAADSYFSKSAKDVTLVEAAALAALPQLPDTYALVKYVPDGQVAETDANIIMREPGTYVANDISAGRRDLCLNLMLEQGYITQAEHDAAYQKSVMDFINPHISIADSDNTYFTDYLLDQVAGDLMEKYDLTADQAWARIYGGGLKIYSTLDATAQKVITKEFNDNDNFPYLVSISYDENDNIIAEDGSVMLYSVDRMFDEAGNFIFGEGEAKFNSDGSLTIPRGNKIRVYVTEVAGETDYSIEFKGMYLFEDYTLYIRDGGYINVPQGYKSLDPNDNVVISKQFFDDYPNQIFVEDDVVKIAPSLYTLAQKTVQPQSACAIVQIGTGQVKALVGGRGTKGQQLFNRALNPRQPGSSIKPLTVYGGSLQRSFELAAEGKKFKYVDYKHDKQGVKYYGDYLTAASVVVDEKMTFNGKEWPKNFDYKYGGATTMREGMRNSTNTIAVKLELQLGDQYCYDLLEKYGLTTLSENDLSPGALALGGLTNGAIPLEMAQAYAAVANGGVRRTSIAYTKVLDRNGTEILTGQSEEIKVLDEGVAWILCDMMKYVVSSGFADGARIPGVVTGGKSGTTNNNYDIWFDGVSPNYACSLWIGTDVNISLSEMSSRAHRLWGIIMSQIPEMEKGEFREMPDNVIRTSGEYFTKGTETGLVSVKSIKEKEEAEKKAKEVTELINKASADNPESVDKALAAYNALSKEGKKLVKNYDKLEKMVTQIEAQRKKCKAELKKWESERSNHKKYKDVLVGYEQKEVEVKPESYELVTEETPNAYQKDGLWYVKDAVLIEGAYYIYHPRETKWVDDKDKPIYETVEDGYEKGWRDKDRPTCG